MAANESRDGARSRPDAPGGQTVLAMPTSSRLILFLGLPGLVLLLGLSLPPLARWALSWETALPLRPVFRFVGAIDRPWEIAVNLAIWLVLALVAAFAGVRDSLKVTITDGELQVEKDDQTRTFPRADVSAVFVDGRKLVVLDRHSHQVVRDTHEASAPRLAEAFRRHGYPWQDSDPYADLFRPWSAGTPDLPPAVNDVLAVREVALKNKAQREISDLVGAVEKMGYVVRDEGTRQYWRPVVQS